MNGPSDDQTPKPAGPPLWAEALVYLLVAFGAVSGALLQPYGVIGDGVDLYGTFWFYWWIGEAITGLKDPGFTDLMFYPLGKDIFAHTGNNFVDALVAQPFQALLGFPRYQPWFVLVVLLGNAIAFRPLARRVLGARARGRGLSWAAWASTLLWMVNPFTLFELMTGRLTQAFLWFLPPAMAFFLQIGEEGSSAPGWKGRWQRLRAPVLAGILTGLQAWTYWFMGWFMAFVFGWLALVRLVRPPVPRKRLLAGWAVAALACLVVVGPAVLAMAGTSDAVPGLSKGGSIFEPPPALSNNVAATLHGYVLMETRGQPMLGYLVWGGGFLAYALFGRKRWDWLGVSILSLVLAVGAVVPLGRGGIVLPHYMVLYHHLPYFDRLWFPYRLVVMTFLGLSLGIGTLVARIQGSRRLRALPGWLLPLLLLGTTLVEQHRHLAFPLIHRELRPPKVYRFIGEEGGGLIELPIGLARISIAFQPVHGQPTFGGMAENASIFWPEGYKRRLSNTFIRELKRVTRDPAEPLKFNPNEVGALVAEGYRWVVLDRHLVDADLHRWAGERRAADAGEDAPFLAQQRIIEALGPPVAVDGPLVVWDLSREATAPPSLQPTEENLGTRTWPVEDMPAYEAHLRELGRIP